MEWQCIGHNPTTWALGKREGERLEDIVATVKRRDDGRWGWWTREGFGIEPSRVTAMDMAEQSITLSAATPYTA